MSKARSVLLTCMLVALYWREAKAQELQTCAQVAPCFDFHQGNLCKDGKRQICMKFVPDDPECATNANRVGANDGDEGGVCVQGNLNTFNQDDDATGFTGAIRTRPFEQNVYLCQTGHEGTKVGFGIRDDEQAASGAGNVDLSRNGLDIHCEGYLPICTTSAREDILISIKVASCPTTTKNDTKICTHCSYVTVGSCSAKCGKGFQIIKRHCPHDHHCHDKTSTISCDGKDCGPHPPTGVWCPWSNWNRPCPHKCRRLNHHGGQVQKTRTRVCNCHHTQFPHHASHASHASHVNCHGSSTDFEHCPQQPRCPPRRRRRKRLPKKKKGKKPCTRLRRKNGKC